MTSEVHKKNAELPEAEVSLLRDLRDTDPDEFLTRLLALRAQKWPFRAIGDAFGVTRVAVRAWVLRAEKRDDLVEAAKHVTVPEIPLDSRGTKLKPVKLVPDVPENDRKRIADLTETARDVKRWTPENADSRLAAGELEELLYFYAVKRGVPVTRLAQYAGVTRRAVAQRIEKQRDRIVA